MTTVALKTSQALEDMFTPESLDLLDCWLIAQDMSCLADHEAVEEHGKLLFIDLRPVAHGKGKATVTFSDNVRLFMADRRNYLIERFGHLTYIDRVSILACLVIPKHTADEFQKEDHITVAAYLRTVAERYGK